MTVQARRRLTERQRDVLARIDRRVPIKLIADELGVSETRINQIIRSLKDVYGEESLGGLVEKYRASAEFVGDEADPDPFRKPEYTNSHLSGPPVFADPEDRVDPGEIVLSDAHHVLIDVPWGGSREPVVVPEALDGEHAVLYRLAVMVGIAFGTIALTVLVITASLSLSTALTGHAKVVPSERGAQHG